MKRLIMVVIFAVLVVGISAGSIFYVNQSVDAVCLSLEQSMHWAQQNNMEQAQQALQTARNSWNERRKLLMIYIEQDLLDEVDNQLAYMDALTRYHQEEYIPAGVLCVTQLREIQSRENLSLSSWF